MEFAYYPLGPLPLQPALYARPLTLGPQASYSDKGFRVSPSPHACLSPVALAAGRLSTGITSLRAAVGSAGSLLFYRSPVCLA